MTTDHPHGTAVATHPVAAAVRVSGHQRHTVAGAPRGRSTARHETPGDTP